jgi:hypothetical protein
MNPTRHDGSVRDRAIASRSTKSVAPIEIGLSEVRYC